MTKSPANLPDGYSRLLSEVKERVRSAQYAALKAVNKELVGLYWDIGRMVIVLSEFCIVSIVSPTGDYQELCFFS
jgi:hypothetical protein